MKVCGGCLKTQQEISTQPCGSQRCPGLTEMTQEQLNKAREQRQRDHQSMQDALRTLDGRPHRP